jgi:CDP-glycerol glycerophosphotransferase (TagB/SpsB family)
MRLFDHVLVAGPKNAERMVAEGVVRADQCSEVGYLKLDLMPRLRAQQAPLFGNDRPTVLYNPHFRAELSSLPAARDIVAQFRAQDRFNLVFAPHIRAFENAGARERAAWEALAVDDRILVDLGSDRLLDMSYVVAADIYLGDVSSQVYEFLAAPRPCVFVDAHGVAWQGDPSYAFWSLGDVCRPAEVMATLAVAAERHATYVERQRAAVAASFGQSDGAARRAAEHILGLIGVNLAS